MHEQPAPDLPFQYVPDQKPPNRAHLWYRYWVWALAIIGALLVVAGAAYLWTHRSTGGSTPVGRMVTYYYRDSTTVLWQGSRLADEDSPTFVHAVADNLIAMYGEQTMQQNGEWEIVTTLDQSLQDAAKRAVDEQRQQMQRQGAVDGALIAQDVTTGQVVAWLGSLEDRVFFNGHDRLTTRTQPGSLAMPLTYAAWIDSDAGVNADTMVADVRGPLPGYSCTSDDTCLRNYDRTYKGPITLRQALSELRTIPAVQAMVSMVPNDTSPGRTASIDKTVESIEALLGGDGTYSCYLPDTELSNLYQSNYEKDQRTSCFSAAAIGEGAYAKPRDIVRAYAALANNGRQVPQTLYLKLQKDGKVLDEWQQADGREIVKPSTANIVNDIVADQSSSYLSRKSFFSVNGQIKVGTITGVTNDAYTYGAVQYTSRYAVGFWGFGSDTTPVRGFSETFTLPATHGWLTSAYEETE